MTYIPAATKLEQELRIAFLSYVGSPFTEKEIMDRLKRRFKVTDAEIYEMFRRCKDTAIKMSYWRKELHKK